MDFSKNYYDTLGVLPSAEPELIKAAFKALSKLYHPDVSSDPEATSKMAEISEAYQVLSDKSLRAEYDSARTDAHEYQSDDSNWGDFSKEDGDVLQKDWEIAAKYHPEILQLERGLSKVSKKLSFVFKAYMLDEKRFSDAAWIARDLRDGFLREYFGTDPEIIAFANKLIVASRKDALRELNRAVRVLGVNSPAVTLIKSIQDEFGIQVDGVGVQTDEFGFQTKYGEFNAFMKSKNLETYLLTHRSELFQAWKRGHREVYDAIDRIDKDSATNLGQALAIASLVILVIVLMAAMKS